MMLDAITGKDSNRTIVTMNRQRDGHRALGEFQPIPIIRIDLKIIRHQLKLLARHLKSRMIVDFHFANYAPQRRFRLRLRAESVDGK